MKLVDLNFPDVFHVVSNMREWDRREIFATEWLDDPADYARTVCKYGSFAWVAGDSEPIAVIGARAMWPGVWAPWMFATDAFPRISIGLTRFVRNNMIPSLRQTGAHRAHCLSMVGHEQAHRWLRLLGAEPEGDPLIGWGRNREDFQVFVWR